MCRTFYPNLGSNLYNSSQEGVPYVVTSKNKSIRKYFCGVVMSYSAVAYVTPPFRD